MRDAQVDGSTEDSRPIVHHTLARKDDPKTNRRDKGIIWPARHLSRDIGPRPPGSSGERSASRFIEKELRSLDLEPESDRFRTPVTTAWSKSIVHLALVIGVLVFPASSHASFALVCIGFVLFLFEEHGRSPFAWLQPHAQSVNLVTRIHPLKKTERKLVILAHMDSPRSAFYYKPGIVRLYRTAFLLDSLCQILIFMLSTVLYGGYLLSMEQDKLSLLWNVSLVVVIPPALALLGLLYKSILGKATPGGNDNASGVAVLEQIARIYSRRAPHNTELWLVFTGASDGDSSGLKRFIHGNRAQLKGAYYIVLDQVGHGFPVCYRREGRLMPFRANRQLLNLARRISDMHANYGLELRRNFLYLSEGYQLLSRGRKAMTVSSRDKSRYPRYWRWRKDDYDNVDPRTLRLSADFIQAMVDNMDRGNLKKK
ncbi:MAG: M28 family peptidase [Actinomycetota bacterium]|nr:M28 family peptidase [Actinomycetota bacterium]